MRVVHIGYQYGVANTGGAAIAASRLHCALLDRGVESYYLCVHQRETGTNIKSLPSGWRRILYFLLTTVLRGIWRFTPYRESIELNCVPIFGMEAWLRVIKPDVVHVHWLNADVASYNQIAKLPYPVVFNLHDLFLLIDIGGYPLDDRFVCGYTRDNCDWLHRWLVNRKRNMICATKSVFIGPSEWVSMLCKKSINGAGRSVYTIPNIISDVFRFDPSLVVVHSRYIILFGGFGGTRNKQKGWHDLVRTLEILSDEVRKKSEIWVFGEDSREDIVAGVTIKFLGNVTNAIEMRNLYHRVDVFAFPSVSETQGMTKVEAMLCGVPVVAFNRTACAEGIEHKQTGWIADSILMFAEGLEYFDKTPFSREQVSSIALARYRSDRLVNKVLSVYRQLMKV